MLDIKSISTQLKLGDDGIWFSSDNQNISYPSGGNENCFAIEDNSFWFKHRNDCIISIVRSYPPKDNGTIFDIGGGNGFVSLGLAKAGFDVALVEPGRVGASNAKNRGLKNVICARSEEHTSELQSHSFISYAVFCLKKKNYIHSIKFSCPVIDLCYSCVISSFTLSGCCYDYQPNLIG